MDEKERQALREKVKQILMWDEGNRFEDGWNQQKEHIRELLEEDIPKLCDEVELWESRYVDYVHESCRIEREKNAEIERLQAKLDDIDRYGTQNERDWQEKAGRLQEENKTLRQCLNDYAPFGVDSE